ncbi:hypothetical protein M3Y94_00652200 [Aphelenchoides besseyi]|nr:hypothetical protein M3Y94_00652200 [Aphelenchoides besseyi]KAI6231147.1 hypothetical protein M3Y95_00350700 [Aphelenchoides besseyi]
MLLIVGCLLAFAAFGDGQRIQNPIRPIQCYACISGTLSDQSRAAFQRDGNVAATGPSYDICDDPFQPSNQQLLQPCSTSCVKSVTENQFTRVVLRGCLTDVAQQLTGRNPTLRIPQPGQCSEQTMDSPNAGRVTTRTCLCDYNTCNGASTVAISILVLFVVSALCLISF